MKKCVLIGGGSTGRGQSSYETLKIDQEIVRMTEKEQPNFLFIGLGDSHSDSYYDTMKKIYKDLGCETKYLKKKNVLNNPDIVKEKIKQADIIYIGGGDTIKLKDIVISYHLDTLLREAYERGTVLVGMSAGAILLAQEGFSDSYILRGEKNSYEFIEGLDLISLSICPHYHENGNKTNSLKESLKQHPREVYGLEDGTAIKMIDYRMEFIRSHSSKHVYLCNYQKEFCENKLL